MEDEGERTLSPKKRAKQELEDAFIAALDKIKDKNLVEEQTSDLQEDDTEVDPKLDLKEEDPLEVELEKIKKEPEEGLTETEIEEIYKELIQLRGIDRKTAEKLVEFGITTIEDIATLEVDMIPETLDISTKSLRTAIKSARKHLEREIEEEKPEKVDEIKPDLQEEEISVEAMMSNLKEEVSQFVNSTKEDMKFCYDKLANFFDELAKLKNDVETFSDRMNKIDNKLNELLTEKVHRRDIDISEAEITESDKIPSEAIAVSTSETNNLSTEELPSSDAKDEKVIVQDTSVTADSSTEKLVPAELTDAEIDSKSTEKLKDKYIFSLDEIVNKLKTVGLLRAGSESYYTICEILTRQDFQEMNYDALFMKSNLPPQTFSQIIFDLVSKKILVFDVKADIVHFQPSK